MSRKRFRAYRVERTEQGQYIRGIQTLTTDDLPDGEVLAGAYSSLNYRDALSATGSKSVTHRYPHTPGIDCVGTTEERATPNCISGAGLAANVTNVVVSARVARSVF